MTSAYVRDPFGRAQMLARAGSLKRVRQDEGGAAPKIIHALSQAPAPKIIYASQR